MSHNTPLAQYQSTRVPRRPSTSGGPNSTSYITPRPSTSSGEVIDTIQAENPFLRAALKGTPDRARSTTPRRQRPTFRSQSYKDEWLHSSSDEKDKKIRTSAQRQPRQRRASEIPVSQNGLSTSSQLGSRATTNRLDKLEKENWDLKHRITLFQNSVQKLKQQLEEREEAAESLINAREHIKSLSKELETASKDRDDALEKSEIMATALTELEQQLEKSYVDQEKLSRDAVDRQAAIVEAAGIIQTYEGRLKDMESQYQQQQISRPDSDYYSAEVDAAQSIMASANTKTMLGDSDYFSADTSPASESQLARQRTIADVSPSLRAAKNSSTAFNQEMGIHDSKSKESLLLKYLQNSQASETSSQTSGLSSRLLRLRSIRKPLPSPSAINRDESHSGRKVHLEVQVDQRPLRNLYASGEPGTRIVVTPGSATSATHSVASRKSPHLATPAPSERDSGSRKAMTSETGSTTTPISPGIPKKAPASTSMYSKLLHFRSNSTTTKPALHLQRQNTSPIMSSGRPQLSPLPPIAQRRYSVDVPRPHSFASSATAQRRSSRSPAERPLSEQTTMDVMPATKHSNARKISSRSSIPLISPTYATPPAQTAPTYSAVKPTTKTHRSPPTPNFSHWPRRYPAWPPSAGLVNRDLLFHGEGTDDLSPTTDGTPSP